MEKVFVVNRRDLFINNTPHGMVTMKEAGDDGKHWLKTIDTRGYFAPRSDAEKDSERKQIIPYCIISVGKKILLLKRLRGGGEKRLHSLFSIGVGGHINPVDSGTDENSILLEGARRELHEEIEIPNNLELEVIGFVNDDTNAVGSVHFGVVLRVIASPEITIRIRERDQLEGKLVDTDELMNMLTIDPLSFETWSKLVLERFEILQPVVSSSRAEYA